MDFLYRRALASALQEIEARQQWEMVNVISLAFCDPKDEDAKKMKINMAMLAFASDPRAMARAIEAVTRKS